ncbi:uncharacterized protein OCT59_024350 [Rhizophagus irregularis]|uniref:uncharacterized protein n=1 Tax=Rhizophagus irregularis TaxID=588596 RepID=UPI000CB4F1D8|nr:hypothetical protein OCT59_024350 [Rhizophagus irregularis]GET58694.1 hypothetical protein RIR_jg14665.t2 [Rhizophagus irregularis DAOM 181602=DAOM 197198]
MEQEEKEIPAQDQPSQDKPELSQELSPLPYTLYENDTHYTIIIYTPCIISKNQLTIGVEYNKLLVIEGSSYILLITKVNPMDKVTVNIKQGLTKLLVKKSRVMLTIA